jgi:drug/metabolite transporter (DMT)-like permease
MYASIFFNFLASSALYVTLSRSFELRGFSILAVSGALAPGLARMLNYRRIPEIGASYTSTNANSAPIFSMDLAVSLLGEKLTTFRLAGNLVVISGLLSLSSCSPVHIACNEEGSAGVRCCMIIWNRATSMRL